MPPTEETMYTMVCKEKFEDLQKILEKIDEKVSGNGRPGLATDVAVLQTEIQTQKSRWKWLIGTSTALCIAIFGHLGYKLIALIASL